MVTFAYNFTFLVEDHETTAFTENGRMPVFFSSRLRLESRVGQDDTATPTNKYSYEMFQPHNTFAQAPFPVR
jgi:hypothetical protein